MTRKRPATISDGFIPKNRKALTEIEGRKSLQLSQCAWLVAHYGAGLKKLGFKTNFAQPDVALK